MYASPWQSVSAALPSATRDRTRLRLTGNPFMDPSPARRERRRESYAAPAGGQRLLAGVDPHGFGLTPQHAADVELVDELVADLLLEQGHEDELLAGAAAVRNTVRLRNRILPTLSRIQVGLLDRWDLLAQDDPERDR